MSISKRKTTAIFLIICMIFLCLSSMSTYTCSHAYADADVPTFDTSNGIAAIEAENAYHTSAFISLSSTTFSGGKALWAFSASETPDPTATGNIEVNVKADKTSIYTLWIRMQTNTKTDQIVFVSADNGQYTSVTAKKTATAELTWVCASISGNMAVGDILTYKLSPGSKSVLIDKLYVTSDRTTHPEGMDATPVKNDTTITNTSYNTPTFTPPPQHPRLYFTKDDIPDILANSLKAENRLAMMQHKINLTKDTDGILSKSVDGVANTNNTWLGWFESWAFEYATKGDEALGRKAIDAIKNYASTVVHIDPNDDAYTRNGGNLIFTISEVYDWCYPLLTQEDKDFLIEQAIIIAASGMEIGWPPVKQSAVTSHGSEAQLLRDILSFAIATYDERPDIYNNVGGRFFDQYLPARQYHYQSHMLHQGSSYSAYRGQWDYNSTWIFDRMGLEKVYGDNQQYTPYWFVYMMRPDGVPFTDGDAGNNGYVPSTDYAKYRRIFFLASNYYNDPYIKYMALKNGSGSSFSYGHGNTSPVEFLIFNKPDLQTKPISDLPLSKYFGSPMGNMIARTGWNDGLESNDAIAQMKIGETWFANHHHLDFGHFQLYYKGLLASDSGRYESYGNEHDLSYNKRTIAHNTMLVYNPAETMSYGGSKVNDGGQRIAGGEQRTLTGLLAGFNNYNAGQVGNYHYGDVLGHEFGPDPIEPDYTYLKGDLTNAYSNQKMSDFDRSFMFYNLKDETHPAALIVFDRVISTNKDFKKTWLLHGVLRPTVNGNQTVFRNDENGYNGKLTVDTLLPKADNTSIDIVGGLENEFYVNGVNYPSTDEYGAITGGLDQTKIHDSDGYRIEVSPRTAATTDYFLNVMQVGQSNPDTPALPVQLIETSTFAGAQIGDRVAMFSKSNGRTARTVSFSFTGSGTYKINVADMCAGTWNISRNNISMGKTTAADDGGLLSFEGEAGNYTLTFVNTITSINLPISISNMKTQTVSGGTKITANISGASTNACIVLSLFDGEKNMTYLAQAPYEGAKTYEFIVPQDKATSGLEAVIMVWSGNYEAVPLSATASAILP